MPASRAPAVLAVVLALVGAASAGLSAAASAATAGAASAATAAPAAPAAPTPTSSPVPTGIPSPLPTTLDPSPSPSPSDSPVDTITVANAVASAVPGGEQLSVTANSTTALASMTVHLFDTTDNTEVLPPLTMSPPADGAAAGLSTWTSDVITTSTLPLGTYNVTVDAADAGTSISGQPAGTFAFQDTPAISPNPVNAVFSHDNQHPILSGKVTTTGPGTGPAVPYANQPVFIADPSLPGGGKTVDTDSEGGYTFAPGPNETYTVEVPATTAVVGASAPPVTFTTRIDPVTMTASLSAGTVTYGGKVTANGTVSYEPGSKFVALRGLTVQVFYDKVAGSPVTTALTDKNGHFTATLPREATSVHWVLRAAGPYLKTKTVTLPMKVSLPTVISGFQASLNQFWQLSFRGCLALPAGVPRGIPSLSGLTIQYAAAPNGPWHTLGALPKQDSVFCGNGGRSFSGTLTAKLNYAYYRAWYAGTTDSTGTGYLATASGKVLAWKYEDRITSFSVSSRTVHKGGKLTVKGQLQYFSGKWRDYAGQKVYAILRPQGSSTWYYIAIATTNSAGRFSSTFTDPVTATWSAEFFGNSAHLATLAAMVSVRVT